MKRLGYLVALAAWAAPIQAQETVGFDPRDSCAKILQQAKPVDQMMIAAWVFGYLAAKQGELRPVRLDNNKVILHNIAGACAKNGNASLLQLIDASKRSTAPGSEADARALLTRFLDPTADLAELTAALRPSEDDIRAVYADPLAGRLVQMYAAMYQPGVAIGPKPGQTTVITTRGTTAQLQQGMAILSDFPGGYKDIVGYFRGDFPIVRFKFVAEGETLGMSFDGLIFVNGRWVLMPKPWRALN